MDGGIDRATHARRASRPSTLLTALQLRLRDFTRSLWISSTWSPPGHVFAVIRVQPPRVSAFIFFQPVVFFSLPQHGELPIALIIFSSASLSRTIVATSIITNRAYQNASFSL